VSKGFQIFLVVCLILSVLTSIIQRMTINQPAVINASVETVTGDVTVWEVGRESEAVTFYEMCGKRVST